jgi:hypothetical protein
MNRNWNKSVSTPPASIGGIYNIYSTKCGNNLPYLRGSSTGRGRLLVIALSSALATLLAEAIVLALTWKDLLAWILFQSEK